jgi:ABC-type Fe3+/spermidine/putrescine transport system ATPase subunit
VTGIVIDRVSRSFGSVKAVDRVELTVGDGEFFTLLGPSGCGKTTLLRMIAGFCELDSGEIRFGERRIDRLAAHRRDIGMVFQNYAVFPNLTVAGNVAYGLKARSVAGAELERRVAEALALVQLAGYGERWPSSRAASCSASPSPARWSSARRFCCSTSRCPTSMHGCASACARRSASCRSRSASPRSM